MTFLLGLIVGGVAGVVITAAWHVATEADREYERWQAMRDQCACWPGRDYTTADAEWAKRLGISL